MSHLYEEAETDIAIMRRVTNGDQAALMLLYDRYGRAVYSLAYRILGSSTAAEEAVQDTFLKAWDQAARWDAERGKLKSWLLAIGHHTAIDRLRRERRQPVLADAPIDERDNLPQPASTNWQERSIMRMLIEKLPPEQAALIDLAFFGGLSHSEIAERTGQPLGTVKTRLRTGLQRLKALWREAEEA